MITKGYFQEISEQEEANFQKNRAKYPEHYLLLEESESAYRILLNHAIDIRHCARKDSRYFDCLKVCVNIPNQLALATLSLYRGHLGDSHFHLRKAIELFGFASMMSKSEDDAAKWRNADNNSSSYSEYKKAFATRNVFPFTDPGLTLLYEGYDISSRYIHSSILSVDEHITPTTRDGAMAFGSSTFTAELPELRFKEQANSLILLHCMILKLLPQLFEKFLISQPLALADACIDAILKKAKPLNEETSRGFGLEPPELKNI
jgi:hypothetical protein